MHTLALASVPTRTYWRLCWLTAGAMLLALLLTAVPSLVQMHPTLSLTRPAPAPAAPTTQQVPPGLGPVLNATLAADHAQEYAVTPLASQPGVLQAANPAQRFATTFGADGVQIAPTSGAAATLRATEIITAGGSMAIPAAQPISAATRVEYRHAGLTEWYINGPRGLEQGFTVATPPGGAGQFTLSLTVAGEPPTQTVDGAILIGSLRYGDLTVIDAVGATLPAHLDVADSNIQIVVDARSAQWPVTIDPLTAQSNLTPQTPPGSTASWFGRSSAIATANGTTTIVVGASSELIGTQDEQGAAYVFTGTGTTYTQSARLIASDGSRQKHFGFSVAITISGGTTTIVVGTFNGSEAYVYTGSGGTYTEQARLVSPNPTNNDNFGSSVAAALNGGTTIIAVGAFGHTVGANVGQGSVYLFAGSGASYPQQIELNDPSPNNTRSFGQSVALVSDGGTNTLAVGAPDSFPPPSAYIHGTVTVFTGSGTSYSAVDLTASDNQPNANNYVGASVAVGVRNGITTVVAGSSPGTDLGRRFGAVYVFAGTGASYTTTKLTDAGGDINDNFGVSVAVGYSYSQTLVAVGVSLKNGNTGNAADGVLLYLQTGASYIQSSLPRANGTAGDFYGASVTMQAASNSDPIVVGGALGNNRAPTGTATVSSWSAQASVQAIFGDGAQTVASPAGAYSGAPFQLAARVVDGNGVAIPPTAVTFTVNVNGGTGGLFTASDPASITLHVITHDGTGGTTAGQTDMINLYPSSTSGAFTVSATADGTALNAIYTLKIIPSVPVPTLNPAIPPRTTGAATNGVVRDAVAGQPAGLSPAMIIIDTSKSYEIHVTGTGFVPQALGTRSFFKRGTNAPYQMDTVYNSSTDLSVFVTGYNLLAGLTADTTASIYVYNPPSHTGGTDGGTSNSLTLVLAMRRPAPTGSSLSSSGATSILAVPGSRFVPAPVQVVNAQGQPIPGVTTGTGSGFVGSKGGVLIGSGGSTLISHDGGSVISNDGGALISHDGGSITQSGAAGAAPPSPTPTTGVSVKQVGSAPVGRQVVDAVSSDYIASTDANSIIMAPPVLSNGIPGTYTRTIAVDGIAQPVTYTITNLNPHDGHPTTITSLSRISAFNGEPAFTLTVTGTGFISGSVISFGGVQLVTTFISATQVSATVPTNLLKYNGTLAVTVINPDPNGGASLPATFTVKFYVNPLPPPQPSAPTGQAPNPLPLPERSGPPAGQAPNPLPGGRSAGGASVSGASGGGAPAPAPTQR